MWLAFFFEKIAIVMDKAINSDEKFHTIYYSRFFTWMKHIGFWNAWLAPRQIALAC